MKGEARGWRTPGHLGDEETLSFSLSLLDARGGIRREGGTAGGQGREEGENDGMRSEVLGERGGGSEY